MSDNKKDKLLISEDDVQYINISHAWGDRVKVCAGDYIRQAMIFGHDASISWNDYGVFINGEQVAERSK